MMKDIAATARKKLTGVLILGASYFYAVPLSFKQQAQIECQKNNQNNDSAIVFVSEGAYLYNEAQLSGFRKISYSGKSKTKEIKINDVFFILEGTAVHNLQNILTYKEKKADDTRAVKSVTQKIKSHKSIPETKNNKLVKPGNIYFSSCNDQYYRLSVSDVRYCIPTLSNNYGKELIFKYSNWTSFSAFSTDLQFEYYINSTSYFFIKSFTIRPPPGWFKYKHIAKVYKIHNLTGSKSC